MLKNTILGSRTDRASLVPAEKNQYSRSIILIGGFFFIFGFVTWINGALIPYLRIACQLQEWESYLVTFAFYISYTVMAVPSGRLLERTGMINGMRIGLGVMAIGCLVFVPAALTRTYQLFLLGLFLLGTGLTILQTAVNPYVTLMGAHSSAAKRMSIMGLCNKFAGVIAPFILGAILLGNSDNLISELKSMQPLDRIARLDKLAHSVIWPYCILSVTLFLVGFLIRFAHLPEIKLKSASVIESKHKRGLKTTFIWRNPHLLLGFIAIFCAVGLEVVTGDTIANYGLYHGLSLSEAKNLPSFALACEMVVYIATVFAIPKLISQEKAFLYSSMLGLALATIAVVIPGISSIVFVGMLNIANAILWAAIWPQALKGLKGDDINKGSAILIMGIAGGAIMPLLYSWLANYTNNQLAYFIVIPCYLFNLYYWFVGEKRND